MSIKLFFPGFFSFSIFNQFLFLRIKIKGGDLKRILEVMDQPLILQTANLGSETLSDLDGYRGWERRTS